MLEQAELKQKSVIKESSAAALTSMLQDVVQHGTGTHANIGRPAAGKTGTTDNYHDAWFVGYTPDLVAGVWVGNDDNTSMGMMTGGMAPAELWRSFMQKVLVGVPSKSFDGSAYTGGGGGEIRDEKSSKSDKVSGKTAKDTEASDAKKLRRKKRPNRQMFRQNHRVLLNNRRHSLLHLGRNPVVEFQKGGIDSRKICLIG